MWPGPLYPTAAALALHRGSKIMSDGTATYNAGLEVILSVFEEVMEEWENRNDRSIHEGADGARYGRDKDGNIIDTPTHYDPAFLRWIQFLGSFKPWYLNDDGEDE
jgi:hypothetical protein